MKRAIALLFTFAALAAAQEFEVASVRVSGPDSPHGSQGGTGHRDATRFSCRSCSMYLLIMKAWDAKPYQISGSVPLERDLYDVIATVPGGATKAEFRTMLQHLLVARLGLHYHVESKMMPGDELVVAKSGFRLKDGDLAAQLLAERDTPVADHTGLTGEYSCTLDFTTDGPGATPDAPPPAPSVFTAIQKELGLQLVAKNLLIDVVVESFNKTPDENRSGYNGRHETYPCAGLFCFPARGRGVAERVRTHLDNHDAGIRLVCGRQSAAAQDVI